MNFFNLNLHEMEDIIIPLGMKRYNAKQLFQWIYQKNAVSFNEMTNIKKEERLKLSQLLSLDFLDDYETYISPDKTIKFKFKLQDGAFIESVLIPEKERNTLCISTQIGCPLACRFCRTGTMGFKRNLETGEITGQILAVKKYLLNRNQKITNFVYMGMGEPLLNFENTVKSIEILKEDYAFVMSDRRITVSTAGITDKIIELGEKTGVNLAISLHAPDQEKRSQIMPKTSAKYPFNELVETLKHYPVPSRKRIMIEYIMLKDVNDSEKDAYKLAKTANKLRAKVNLIPFNTFAGAPFEKSSEKRIEQFRDILISKNITAIIRKSRGSEEYAACGQLASF